MHKWDFLLKMIQKAFNLVKMQLDKVKNMWILIIEKKSPFVEISVEINNTIALQLE